MFVSFLLYWANDLLIDVYFAGLSYLYVHKTQVLFPCRELTNLTILLCYLLSPRAVFYMILSKRKGVFVVCNREQRGHRRDYLFAEDVA